MVPRKFNIQYVTHIIFSLNSMDLQAEGRKWYRRGTLCTLKRDFSHPCLVRYQTQDASWGRGGRGSAVEGGRDAIGGGRPAGGSSFQLRSSRGAGRGGLSASCSPFNRDSLFFFFLVAPHGMQDLSSLARDRTPHHLNWQHAVLTTGPLGKSRPGFILEGWLS